MKITLTHNNTTYSNWDISDEDARTNLEAKVGALPVLDAIIADKIGAEIVDAEIAD
jgi:hypothetical protein